MPASLETKRTGLQVRHEDGESLTTPFVLHTLERRTGPPAGQLGVLTSGASMSLLTLAGGVDWVIFYVPESIDSNPDEGKMHCVRVSYNKYNNRYNRHHPHPYQVEYILYGKRHLSYETEFGTTENLFTQHSDLIKTLQRHGCYIICDDRIRERHTGRKTYDSYELYAGPVNGPKSPAEREFLNTVMEVPIPSLYAMALWTYACRTKDMPALIDTTVRIPRLIREHIQMITEERSWTMPDHEFPECYMFSTACYRLASFNENKRILVPPHFRGPTASGTGVTNIRLLL